MVRYMAITEGPFKKAAAGALQKDIWFMQDKPPDVPYLQLDVKVKRREERFSGAITRTRQLSIFGIKFLIEWPSKRQPA